jgi:hypothetical protein
VDTINVKDFGATGDGATDDSSAVQASIDAVMGTTGAGPGGTIYFPPGTYRLATRIAIRNSGATYDVTQPPLRLVGSGSTANGREGATYVSFPAGGSTLDFEYVSTIAHIDTRGEGRMEITGLNLYDGTGISTILQTTNTSLLVHRNAFIGAGAGGTASVTDAIVLGGAPNTTHYGQNDERAPFQGYPTTIDSNTFTRVRHAVVFNSAANGVQLVNNQVTIQAGSGTAFDAPIVLQAASPEANRGNYIAGNLVETRNYAYSFKIGSGASQNLFIGNHLWDPSASTTAGYCIDSGGNTIIGYADSGFTTKVFGCGVAKSNLMLDLGGSAMLSNFPFIRTPQLIPVQITSFPSQGGAVGLNMTTTGSAQFQPLGTVSAFTVNAPTTPAASAVGQVVWVVVKNSSSSAVTVTWNAAYKMAAWGSLAAGYTRSIMFWWDGGQVQEMFRSPADVPN